VQRIKFKNWRYTQSNSIEFFFKHNSRVIENHFSIELNSIRVHCGNWLFLQKQTTLLVMRAPFWSSQTFFVTRSASISESLFLSLLAAPRFKGFRNSNRARDRTLGARKIVGKNTLYRFAVRESRDSFLSAGREIRGLERPTYLSLFTHYTSAVNDSLPLW